MQYIADLHLHSPFSRATSKKGDLAGLFAWARMKGIHVVGTGDFTHPQWLAHLKEHLQPAEPGFFRLKNENVPPGLPDTSPEAIPVRFVLTVEISTIYKKDQKVRKVHHVLFVPDLASVERLNARLASIGNIESDGRPILGLDSRDLLEILLETTPEGFLVPAHVWTPWFSVLGSKSGFDSLEECFADLTGHIFALETGLSSDPDMNRLVSALDRFTLISNSDAHSPAKLGREANRFATGFDFFSLREALREPSKGFLGTIEFFPEEGKYHLDGHRKCQVCLAPEETRQYNGLCPVCQRPLTIGVMHRVRELADRETPYYPEGDPGFHSLIPLPEVLGEIMRTGPESKRVLSEYTRVINLFGSEYNVLLQTPLEDLSQRYSPLLGEAIRRIRAGTVHRVPGYDGTFGKITVFAPGELDTLLGQISLFPQGKTEAETVQSAASSLLPPAKPAPLPSGEAVPQGRLNPEQAEAVASTARHLLVSAGPGTGKTFTLIARLVHLLATGQVSPARVVAITFTNRAAEEVRERLRQALGPLAQEVLVGTFHHFCLHWLRKEQPDLVVVGEEGRLLVLKSRFPELDQSALRALSEEISAYFHLLSTGEEGERRVPSPAVQRYLAALEEEHGIDLEAVLPFFSHRLSTEPAFRQEVCQAIDYVFVDEFQDLNAAQYRLVKTLAEKAGVFAIGDPNQAIYGFRGADLRFFYRFAEECGAQTLTLTRNYRSSPTILDAATAVISHNSQQGESILVPQRNRSSLIEHYLTPTPQAEAELIVRRIEELVGGISHFSIDSGRGGEEEPRERSFKDMAILYRLSLQAQVLGETLERHGIPFQVVGVTPFFLTPAIRSAYHWIRAAVDPAAPEHLFLLGRLQGIGPVTLRKMERELPLRYSDFFHAAAQIELPSRTREKLRELQDHLRCFQEKSAVQGIEVALAPAMAYLGIDTEQAGAQRLLRLASAFGKDLVAFATYLEQQASGTVYDERIEAVALMTLHAAKGLEFPVVFITGLEEGIFPCRLQGLSSDLAEERRLFYVGITRAQDRLILTSSATRTLFGVTTRRPPSRFVAEIPSHLLRKTVLQRESGPPAPTQLSLFS
ncbi:MAG: DNA helicase II [Nitrospinota bacterium]|nr:MAG: DNA helicase II [Nitrospinota bacterium]